MPIGHVEQHHFSLPKAGNADEEYEDAFWLPAANVEHRTDYRCAVADGATETSFSGLWAKLLVDAFGMGTIGMRLDQQALLPLQQQWSTCVSDKQLPWYAEEKARQGAYASLLGLTLTRRGRQMRWNAVAVGDSCLFQFRGHRMIMAFPIACSADFNNRPHLISSQIQGNEALNASISFRHGSWDEADVFFLMTDALACWFLRSLEDDKDPWRSLYDLGTDGQHHSFTDWIVELRDSGTLRNDDVTLLRIAPTPERA